MVTPTKKEQERIKKNKADKLWDGLDLDIRSQLPLIIREGMKRSLSILKDEKASDSNALRAAKDALDMYRWVLQVEEEGRSRGAGNNTPKDDSEEDLPIISLVATS